MSSNVESLTTPPSKKPRVEDWSGGVEDQTIFREITIPLKYLKEDDPSSSGTKNDVKDLKVIFLLLKKLMKSYCKSMILMRNCWVKIEQNGILFEMFLWIGHKFNPIFVKMTEVSTCSSQTKGFIKKLWHLKNYHAISRTFLLKHNCQECMLWIARKAFIDGELPQFFCRKSNQTRLR